MDAFDEVKDPRRVRLISEIASQIGQDNGVDAGFWAFVWLADLEELEKFTTYFKTIPNNILKQSVYLDKAWIKTLKTWTTRDRSSKNQSIVGGDGERKRKSETHTESSSPTKLPRRPGDAIQDAEDVTRLSSDFRGASTRSRSSSPSRIPRAVPTSMVSPSQALPGTPAEPVSPKMKNPEAKRYGRSTFMADKCRERDNWTCLITKGGDSVEVAHIYPFSLGQKAGTKKHTDFWDALSTYWSPSKIKDWENVVIGQQGTEILSHLMSLAATVHGMWGDARFALKPHDLSEDQKTLRAVFYWMPSARYGLRYLKDPPTPSRNVDCSVGRTCFLDCQSRSIIRSGDILTFTTPDPKKWPLPSVQLLHMQWLLNRLVAITGAADVTDEELDSDELMDLDSPILVGYDDDDDEEEEEEEAISPGM